MMSWRALAVLAVVASVAFSLGWQMPRWIAERPATPASPVQEVSTPRPPETPPALRCIEEVTFTARNEPVYTARTWTQAEAETQYHQAKQYLATAESAGLWNDTGQRAVRLATAQLLEILVCRGGTP